MTVKQRCADLLEWLSAGRWRRAGLGAVDLLPPATRGTGAGPPPDDPFQRAWMLAEEFACAVRPGLGQYCTPRPVAAQLAADTVEKSSGYIVDPACGAGALLLAAAEQLRRHGGPAELDRLVGADIDPVAVAVAEAVIWLAAGAPDRPVGRFLVRDFLAHGCRGLLDNGNCLVLANPPWGVKLAPEAIDRWARRVGPECASLLRGERNIYSLFLAELLLCEDCSAGFVTPIHWLHLRSLMQFRQALAETGRLDKAFVLRKHVFPDAPDMIPVLTCWQSQRTGRPIEVRRSGFDIRQALGIPLESESSAQVTADEWRETPFCIFPMLRTRQLSAAGRVFARFPVRFGDTTSPRGERLFHIGDGIYKSKIKGTTASEPIGWPILTRASETGRYRLDRPNSWLTETGMEVLSESDRRRFGGPMLLLHALKKANAPWRLASVLTARQVPLAVTNNFVVATPVKYDGDLHYPLTLLNSRLFNRIYTEHFPGVNIESYSVGSMPLPWPTKPSENETCVAPHGALRHYTEWARGAVDSAGTMRDDVYRWLCEMGSKLNGCNELQAEEDQRIEAVLVGALGLDDTVLDLLLRS